MIIQGPGFNPFKLYSEQTKNAKTSSQTTARNVSSTQDQVELSSRGQEFGQILNQIRSLPEVRQERMAKIKEQLDSGTYQVDAKSLAEDILKSK